MIRFTTDRAIERECEKRMQKHYEHEEIYSRLRSLENRIYDLEITMNKNERILQSVATCDTKTMG